MRIYYYIPEGCGLINLVASPGHYGKTISSIRNTDDALIHGIPEDLKALLVMENLDASIEIGASRWDKGVCRVRHQIKFKHYYKFPLKKIEEMLEAAGIYPFPDDFGCY